jgi:predicted PurR-regulated permease PerM
MTHHDDSLGNHPSPSDRALSPVDWIRLAVLIVLTVILIGLSVALALPFLPAITWAVALAILGWPVHRWISRRIGKRGVAAGISTAGVAAVILGTSLFITYQIASETASVAKGIDDGEAEGGALWKKAESVPVLGPAIGWLERVGLDVRAGARSIIES